MFEHLLKYPIEDAATFATILPLAALWYRQDYKRHIEKYFFLFLLSKLIIELVMLYMASRVMNNLYLYNTLVFMRYCLLARMCYEAIDIKAHKMIVVAGSVLFVISFCIDVIDVGMLEVVQISGTLECLLLIIYIILYFYGLCKSLKIPNLFTYPVFWIFSGLLIFYSTSTFATPIYNMVERFDGGQKDIYVVVLIPYVCESIYLLMITFGLFLEE